MRRMSYAEAIARYGSDKPDLRCGLEIHDLSEGFRDSEFRVFKQIIAGGGVVRGFAVPGGNKYTRSQIDILVDQAKQMGFPGLIWVRPGQPPLSSVKALGEAALRPALDTAKVGPDDLLLMAAGPADNTSKLLGQLRLAIAKKENLLDPEKFEFLWVTDFPLLEYHDEDTRWYSMHHPFTAPRDEDIDKLESDPGAVRAKAYDLVLNGSEIGGGSIRIHDAALQARIFQRLGISDEEAKLRFGFFLETLFGSYDENLKHLESLFNVRIRTQGHDLLVEGESPNLDKVDRVVGQLSSLMRDGFKLSNSDVKTAGDLVAQNTSVDLRDHFLKGSLTSAGKRRVAPK